MRYLSPLKPRYLLANKAGAVSIPHFENLNDIRALCHKRRQKPVFFEIGGNCLFLKRQRFLSVAIKRVGGSLPRIISRNGGESQTGQKNRERQLPAQPLSGLFHEGLRQIVSMSQWSHRPSLSDDMTAVPAVLWGSLYRFDRRLQSKCKTVCAAELVPPRGATRRRRAFSCHGYQLTWQRSRRLSSAFRKDNPDHRCSPRALEAGAVPALQHPRQWSRCQDPVRD